MNITFPPKSPGGPNEDFPGPGRYVVVGANGSGKTRFGIFLDDNNPAGVVHRIAAQKALAIPNEVQNKHLTEARKDLLYGRHDEHASHSRKVHDRFGGDAATALLSDYPHVLSLIFASSVERDRLHTEATRKAQQFVPVEDSVMEQIVRVWDYVLPHRTIEFKDGQVNVVRRGDNDGYHAKGMSDGERVALYLLGQCLTAAAGTVLVVDEPELHLHRALMDKLWDKLEELCPDKTIVYITHDLAFAASRIGATKIWVKSFERSAWTWVELPKDDAVPEALMMEVLGSRKPLLFCEGDQGGLDHMIYQRCFPALHVVPRGGCAKVIEATKALKDNKALHAYSPRGVIDRDVRTDAEIAALEGHGVYVLAFAEIENLLCVRGLVELVARRLGHDEVKILGDVTDYIKDALSGELQTQIAMRAADRVRFHLEGYSALTNDEAGVRAGVSSLLVSLDVDNILAEAATILNNALAAGDLNSLLAVYNRKSLAGRISGCFGLKPDEYKEMVLRVLASSDSAEVTTVVKPLLPNL